MAYREKLAWLYLAAIALVYAVYFIVISARPPEARLIDMLWLFAPAAAAHGLIAGIGTLVIRAQTAASERGPADERDRAIARRGASAAYGVMLLGMIFVGVIMPFGDPPWKVVNTALLSIVIAEIVHSGVIVASYRRGWHG